MKNVVCLKCVLCGIGFAPAPGLYVCAKHGDDGILDVQYDYAAIQEAVARSPLAPFGSGAGMWRYLPLLPVAPNAKLPPLAIGDTPLYEAPRLAAELGLKDVWVKDDGRQPSASFKDRASALALVKAQEAGAKIIATASTGNAAAALACVCASVGQPCVIFVPAKAPPAKITQLLVYGAKVLLVDGTYDDAFELCLKACAKYGWYNRNTAYNPYMAEGKKTAAYEICEQLGAAGGKTRFAAPGAVFVPTGDGCIIAGMHKGFKDLLALKWIDRMPRLFGVQAEGSDYLWQAWTKNEDVLKKTAIATTTVADSIAAGMPRDRVKAMAAVQETKGAFVRVSDNEILAAIPRMAQAVGVFSEPAAAAALAGLATAVTQRLVDSGERIVLLATGSGLKDVASAMRTVAPAEIIKPELAEVERVLQNVGA